MTELTDFPEEEQKLITAYLNSKIYNSEDSEWCDHAQERLYGISEKGLYFILDKQTNDIYSVFKNAVNELNVIQSDFEKYELQQQAYKSHKISNYISIVSIFMFCVGIYCILHG